MTHFQGWFQLPWLWPAGLRCIRRAARLSLQVSRSHQAALPVPGDSQERGGGALHTRQAVLRGQLRRGMRLSPRQQNIPGGRGVPPRVSELYVHGRRQHCVRVWLCHQAAGGAGAEPRGDGSVPGGCEAPDHADRVPISVVPVCVPVRPPQASGSRLSVVSAVAQEVPAGGGAAAAGGGLHRHHTLLRLDAGCGRPHPRHHLGSQHVWRQRAVGWVCALPPVQRLPSPTADSVSAPSVQRQRQPPRCCECAAGSERAGLRPLPAAHGDVCQASADFRRRAHGIWPGSLRPCVLLHCSLHRQTVGWLAEEIWWWVPSIPSWATVFAYGSIWHNAWRCDGL